MIKHHRIAHIDWIRLFHPERTLAGPKAKKAVAAWRGWLPAVGAEALLLTSFVLWLQNESTEYHGLALVFAWIVYGLIALSFLYLWTEPDDAEADHQQ